MRRFDPASLLAAGLFGAVSAAYLTSGFSGGVLPVPVVWLVPALLIGLGVVGIARAVSRRRDR